MITLLLQETLEEKNFKRTVGFSVSGGASLSAKAFAFALELVYYLFLSGATIVLLQVWLLQRYLLGSPWPSDQLLCVYSACLKP